MRPQHDRRPSGRQAASGQPAPADDGEGRGFSNAPGWSCWKVGSFSPPRSTRSTRREAARRVRGCRARCPTSSPRLTLIPTPTAARSRSTRRSSRRRRRSPLAATLTLSESSGPEVIDGPGAGLLTVSGGGANLVFLVDDGITASISGVTISGGDVSGRHTNGGGLSNYGVATLTGCMISGNSAFYGRGAGLYSNGSLTLTACTINGNSARYGRGGGLHNSGMSILTDCTISGNNSNVGGGGLYNRGTATLTDCTISGNSTYNLIGGGLLNCYNATLTVTGCTISGNSRRRTVQPRHGDAHRLHDQRQLLHHRRRTGEPAARRRSPTARSAATPPSTRAAAGCTTSARRRSPTARSAATPPRYGGGLDNRGTATLTDCTISGNSASVGGGLEQRRHGDAHRLHDQRQLRPVRRRRPGSTSARRRSPTARSAATPPSTAAAGWTTSGTATLDRLHDQRQLRRQHGGGLYNYGTAGTATLTACTISGNSAGDAGGGLYNDRRPHSSETLTDTIVAGNTEQRRRQRHRRLPCRPGHRLVQPDRHRRLGRDHRRHRRQHRLDQPQPTWAWPRWATNGGPTQTMALLPGSPAIGTPASPSAASPPTSAAIPSTRLPTSAPSRSNPARRSIPSPPPPTRARARSGRRSTRPTRTAVPPRSPSPSAPASRRSTCFHLYPRSPPQ